MDLNVGHLWNWMRMSWSFLVSVFPEALTLSFSSPLETLCAVATLA
jgi:hypothetical protein